MKKRTMQLIAFAGIGVLGAVGGVKATGNSDTLAAHTLSSLDGGTTTLSAFRGEVVVVNFWATWCAPCRHELPLLDQWNTQWKSRGARVVAISIDQDPSKVRSFVKEMKLSLTVMHDGPDGLARSLDIPAVPYTLLLDRDGNVIETVRGSAEAEVAALGRKVETMLAARGERPVQEAGVAGGTR
jgi:thiol-disulfide isomerase/thioredoxin